MSEPKQRIIESNGIHLNIAEQGEGPVALLPMAGPNPGTRGDINWAPLPQPASTP